MVHIQPTHRRISAPAPSQRGIKHTGPARSRPLEAGSCRRRSRRGSDGLVGCYVSGRLLGRTREKTILDDVFVYGGGKALCAGVVAFLGVRHILENEKGVQTHCFRSRYFRFRAEYFRQMRGDWGLRGIRTTFGSTSITVVSVAIFAGYLGFG